MTQPAVPRRRAAWRHVRIAIASIALVTGCGDDPPSGPGKVVHTTFVAGRPAGWVSATATADPAFEVGRDSGVVRSGTWSAAFRSHGSPAKGAFVGLQQAVNATPWRGKRMRLRSWVRTDSVGARGALLFMRVDGMGDVLALGNTKRVSGTLDWQQLEIVIDVPAEAIGFAFGPLLADTGRAWFDDLALEEVGSDVAVTTSTQIPAVDSAGLRWQLDAYARLPRTLRAGGFEGIEPATTVASAAAWLRDNVVPLTGDDPAAPLTDLAPLGAMIGDAELVGLGEGTHGTREFFRMKHRIVEYLVRERGFTAFAIEANWPEANAIDTWVRGGPGDTRMLLANLYFWTWNTEEVLALMRWMREYNATVPPERQVRFFGFDMQYPGTAIDTVQAYVRRVDPAGAASVDEAYGCLANVRNFGPTRGTVPYNQLSADARARCDAAVAGVHARLLANAAAYAAASSAVEYARAVQSARLVVQWTDYAQRPQSEVAVVRDRYMAENTDWLLAQLPPGARMVLWAHNAHVTAERGKQGERLRARHGARYVNVGFTFGTGFLTAIDISGGQVGAIRTHSATLVPEGTFEAYARQVPGPAFLLDARRIPSSAAALPLAGPLGMRSIGAGFSQSSEATFFYPTLLPDDFDLIVHVQSTTATRLLP